MEGEYQLALMNQSPPSHMVPFAVTDAVVSPPPQRERIGASTNDQRFLLIFILSNYFGPDLRAEPHPKKSAYQRAALQLPNYCESDVHNSVFRLSEVEAIYYYILRNAHPTCRVKLQSLYKFLQGHLAPPVREILEDDRQFPVFFPAHLHKQSRYKGTYKVIEGVVFIDNPDFSLVREEDVERFKRLSNCSSLAQDRSEACRYPHGQRTDRDEERQARFNAVTEQTNNAEHGILTEGLLENGSIRKRKKKKGLQAHVNVNLAPASPLSQTIATNLKPDRSFPGLATTPLQGGPLTAALLLLPCMPNASQWQNIVNAAKPAIALTGTAAARQAGPVIGLVDIGVCEDAYLFRAALPGVKKDEGDFNCEVECDGQVTIKGTTVTGDAHVVKGARTFVMQTQNLCPPGSFTVAFSLPGPVEPSQFTGTFGSDGILEGIVLKQQARSGTASLTFQS
eukprot:jgi/Mesen1/1123/ME000123S00287